MQFYQIYLISLFTYISRLYQLQNLTVAAAGYIFPLAIYRWAVIRWFLLKKYLIRSALNVEYETSKQSNMYTLLRNNQRVGPFYYFNRWGPFFIISTGGAPSLLFQQVGPLLHYFNEWAPSLSFQWAGPFYYFNGCMGPLFYYFNGWGPFFIISRNSLLICSHLSLAILIVINFRSNYSQIVHFQV